MLAGSLPSELSGQDPLSDLVHQDSERMVALLAKAHTTGYPLEAVDELGYLADRMQNLLLSFGSPLGHAQVASSSGSSQSVVLDELTAGYDEDARRDDHASKRLTGVAIVTATLAVAIAVLGAVLARGPARFDSGEFVAFFCISIMLLVVTAVALVISGRLRIASREATRIRRQIGAVDWYLDSMPHMERDLLRGALVGRLFPRLLEDDDPTRETQLPSTRELLDAISWSDGERVVSSEQQSDPLA